MKVMYPGSFDPITLGHIDLIERCSRMFGEVVVALMENDAKNSTFSVEERLLMIEDSVKHLPNVTVLSSEGLTIDFAREQECRILIRGIRAVMDYEYELQYATANRVMDSNMETLFLVASPKYSYISSSVARTVARYGGDLSEFVPKRVADLLLERLANKE